MDVSSLLFIVYCKSSGLCDELITYSLEFYGVCVCVCLCVYECMYVCVRL